MARKKVVYQNFNEYAKNDKKYFLKSLKGELFKPQKRKDFSDGTNYVVTSAGYRWWSDKWNRPHREDGPALIGKHTEAYFLHGKEYKIEEWKERLADFKDWQSKFPFADTNLMIVEYGKDKWVNPFISSWYAPKENSEHDLDMYRAYLKNSKDEILRIYFKSEYLDAAVKKYSARTDWETNPKQSMFADPYIDSNMIFFGLEFNMLEDCWGPYAPENAEINTKTKEFAKWSEDDFPSQFCFTEFGEKVSDFFDHEVSVDFFSLDCGLVPDGDDWICES